MPPFEAPFLGLQRDILSGLHVLSTECVFEAAKFFEYVTWLLIRT